MPRGIPKRVGDRYVSKNGYHYIRMASGWRLEHHVIAEVKFGRRINTEFEVVYFVDRNKDNLDPDNIDIRSKKLTKKDKIARIDLRIQELQALREETEAS